MILNPFKDAIGAIHDVRESADGALQTSSELAVRSASGITTLIDTHYGETLALAFDLTMKDGSTGLLLDYNARGSGEEGVPRIIKNLQGQPKKTSQIGWPLGRIIHNLGAGYKCISIGPVRGAERDWRKHMTKVVSNRSSKHNTREQFLAYIESVAGDSARHQVENSFMIADAAELPPNIYPSKSSKGQ